MTDISEFRKTQAALDGDGVCYLVCGIKDNKLYLYLVAESKDDAAKAIEDIKLSEPDQEYFIVESMYLKNKP